MNEEIQEVPLLEDVNGVPVYLCETVYQIPNSAHPMTGRIADQCAVVGVGRARVWIKSVWLLEEPREIPANQLTHDNWGRITHEAGIADYEYCCKYNLSIADGEDMHTVVKKHLIGRAKKMVYLHENADRRDNE